MSRKPAKVQVPTNKVPIDDIPERHKDIADVFKLFDKDGNGRISRDEVTSLLRSLGRNSTPQEIDNLIRVCDKDNNGTIELSEFTAYMDDIYVVPRSKVEEIIDCFRIFDLDGNGYVTQDEFKSILTRYGGDFTEEEVKEIFNETDFDKDGRLSYAEFVDLWKYQ